MQDVFSSVKQEQEIEVDAARSAVLVIDMLNDFCKQGGKMVLPGSERLIPRQLEVINAARSLHAPLFWIQQSHDSRLRHDRELAKRGPHCFLGTWGVEVVDDLKPQIDDFRIYKHRYSAFFQTDLDLLLKDMLCDQLIIFGVVTNICVRSTVHDAFFNGYEVIVVEDCCAGTGEREHTSSLYDIATHFGVVTDARSVIDALRRRGKLSTKAGIAT